MFLIVIVIAGVNQAEMEASNQNAFGCALEADYIERVVRAQPLEFPPQLIDIVCLHRDAEPAT